MSLQLFAGLRVRDLQAAQRWYQRLFGEPSFFPNATVDASCVPMIGNLVGCFAV